MAVHTELSVPGQEYNTLVNVLLSVLRYRIKPSLLSK